MGWILDSTAQADVSAMGGKAAALARLWGGGFHIPPWFVIHPGAYEAHRRGEDVCAAITSAVIALEGDGLLAVRSSAVDEDGTHHSFAGQLKSFLFVPREQVMQRVTEVWQSGFAEQVMTYRRERGLDAANAAPAVLVQRMIDADVSGVAFSADPIGGSRGTAVVSAVYGLGTALVSGDADADTWRVDRTDAIIDRSIAHKASRHVADVTADEGVSSRPVDPALADQAALDDAMIRAVAQLARDAAAHFGCPQDIEWAIAEGRLYLLQSRPITSLAALADPEGISAIWDNSNIAESYSGITTPLTFTFARLAYDGVYRAFCRMMKVPADVVQDNDAMFGQMLGLIRGRVYYNLLNWYRLLAMLPGFSVNRGFMEQMMGVREGLPEEIARELTARTWSQRQADRLRLAISAGGLIWNHWVVDRKIRRFYVRLDDALKPPAVPLSRMRLDELADAFRNLQRRLLTQWDAPLINDFLAMMFFGVLGKLCAKWCGDDSEHLRNDLISDEGGMISAEPARRIVEMAKLAAGDERLIDALCDAPVFAAQRALGGHGELSAAYRSYLEKFGDRCLEELKLESSTLEDDPTPLLRAIGHAARRVRSGETRASVSGAARHAAEGRVMAALRRKGLRRRVFGWVLRHARRRVRDRENLRFERTRLFGRVRRIFLEAGRRLAAEGKLDDPRDVLYLTVDEVLGFVEGTSVGENVRGIARVRREEFGRYRQMPVPAERFETRGAVYVGNRFEAAPRGTVGSDGSEIRGIGCCAGVVRGRARVIRDPRGAQLAHGEILVAERTDPGWIMLFPAAAGILVERGSLLSHSAIVAREMGIPAVVSIPGLLARVEDGQWVEMDGSAGTVRLVGPPQEAG